MHCKSRIVPKQYAVAAAVGVLVLFSSQVSQAQITPSADSYINAADPFISHLTRAMFSYFTAVVLAYTILVALACAGVLALAGIYISHHAHSLNRVRSKQNRSSLNLVQPSINPWLLLE